MSDAAPRQQEDVAPAGWRGWVARLLPSVLLGIWVGLVQMGERHIDVVAARPATPLHGHDALVFVFSALVGTLLALALTEALHRCSGLRAWHRGSARHWFLGSWLLLVLVWGLTWARYFPGVMSVDSFDQLDQVTGRAPWSTHHPLVSTGGLWLAHQVVGWFGGGPTATVALTSAAQLVATAAGLAYVVAWLVRRGAGVVVAALVLLALALDPAISYYAITIWKDVPFSALTVVLLTVLWDVVSRPERLRSVGYLAALAALSAALVAYRHNGILVVGMAALGLLVVFRKRSLRAVGAALAAAVVASAIVGPLVTALGVKAPAKAEGAAIPLQVVAYTMREGGHIEPADEKLFETLLPRRTWVTQYRPATADRIKFQKDFDNTYFDAHQGEFRSAWLRTAAHNPREAASAWLLITSGYWTTDTTNWILWRHRPGDYAARGIEHTNLFTRSHVVVEQTPDMRVRRDILESPALYPYYNLGSSVLLMGLWALVVLRRRRPMLLVGLLPLLGVWGSLMVAAPVHCEFRYMYPIHLALPLLAGTAFLLGTRNDVEDERAETPAPEETPALEPVA